MHTLRNSPWFLSLICVLLIAVRISGAHWHLCFDHNEPPLTMHVGDIDGHAGNDTGDHQDIDLKLVEDGLTKSLSAGLDIPMILAVIALLWLLPRSRRLTPLPGYREPFFSASFRPLHASPRAPPR